MKTIFKEFLVWRVFLLIVLFIAIPIVPMQFNFLGGGLDNYLKSPHLWGWANFDGDHYLSIARSGYRSLTYFFFPMYPLLIRNLSVFLPGNFISFLYSGLLVSNIALLFAMYGLYKLVRLDFDKKIAKLSIVLLLLFPTSFFLGSVYTESLFLALVVWAYYFARVGNWYMAGVLGGLSTATRITGLALLPAFLYEYYSVNKGSIYKLSLNNFKNIFSILLVGSGIGIYMYFLYQKTGDPLAFFHNLDKVFGEQRSDRLIMLPQVFYRYIFKVLPALNYGYFPGVFTAWLEFISAGIFLLLVALSYFKLRLGYFLFAAVAYILPTLSGSFSSFPRYVLVIFPAFIVASLYLSKLNKLSLTIIYIILIAGLLSAFSLYIRGYWIS